MFKQPMRSTIILTLLLIPALLGAGDKPLALFTIMPGADVVLQDEYGVMLVNDGNENKPVPRYILAIRKSCTLVDTRDIEVFRAALGKVPKGTKMNQYDSCTVPRSWGLSDAEIKAFERAITRTGLSVSNEDRRITCYCDAIKKSQAAAAKPASP